MILRHSCGSAVAQYRILRGIPIHKEVAMKTILGSRKHQYLRRGAVLSVALALIAGLAGCGGGGTVITYDLAISSSEGGSVTTPGEGTHTYNAGTSVNLVATADAVTPSSTGPAMWAPLPMSGLSQPPSR
jgi:hypothetical protein